MVENLLLDDFLHAPGVVFDVRSPAEYTQGRIPGAVNLPLFSNEERAVVGTAYKGVGKGEALEAGLRFAGPKLADFVLQAKSNVGAGAAKLLCSRGGMRSAAMAWLLDFAEIRTFVLKGGYKAFRRWVLRQFDYPYSLLILGGLTGSGKTSILAALKSSGEQVLDLENFASHRGSSFGIIGMGIQPSTEQFENEIAMKLARFDKQRPIWVEDESQQIGVCNIPGPFFVQMRLAPLAVIEVPLEERLERLVWEYGGAPAELLIAATKRIGKKLGLQRTKEIVELICEGRLRDAVANLLQYYDESYRYGLSQRSQPRIRLVEQGFAPDEWAYALRCAVGLSKVC